MHLALCKVLLSSSLIADVQICIVTLCTHHFIEQMKATIRSIYKTTFHNTTACTLPTLKV